MYITFKRNPTLFRVRFLNNSDENEKQQKRERNERTFGCLSLLLSVMLVRPPLAVGQIYPEASSVSIVACGVAV